MSAWYIFCLEVVSICTVFLHFLLQRSTLLPACLLADSNVLVLEL